MKQTTKGIKKVQGGFSDIRLWPCYSIVGALALFLIPRIGVGLSSILIYTAVILATRWALPRMTIPETDFTEWRSDIEFARANGLEYPDCHDYEFMKDNTVKVPKKVKASKETQPKTPRLKLATPIALEAQVF